MPHFPGLLWWCACSALRSCQINAVCIMCIACSLCTVNPFLNLCKSLTFHIRPTYSTSLAYNKKTNNNNNNNSPSLSLSLTHTHTTTTTTNKTKLFICDICTIKNKLHWRAKRILTFCLIKRHRNKTKWHYSVFFCALKEMEVQNVGSGRSFCCCYQRCLAYGWNVSFIDRSRVSKFESQWHQLLKQIDEICPPK